MGVLGLQTFINNNNIGENVYLHNIKEDCRQGGKPHILIDGNSLLYYIHKKCYSNAVWGGDYNILHSYVKKFFYKIKKNIVLEVIFDGITPIYKNDTINNRRKTKCVRYYKIWSNIKKNNSDFKDIAPPIGLIDIIIKVLKNLNIHYCVADEENDDYISWKCIKYKYQGIIAQDTDYLIYPISCYIPLNTITFTNDGTKVLMIKPSMLANHLKLEVNKLPILATLIGNDIFSKKYINSFYKDLNSLDDNSKWFNIAKKINENKNFTNMLQNNEIKKKWDISVKRYHSPKPKTNNFINNNDKYLWNIYRKGLFPTSAFLIRYRKQMYYSSVGPDESYNIIDNLIELRQKYYSVLTKDVIKEMQWRYYKKDVFLKEWYVVPSKKYKDINFYFSNFDKKYNLNTVTDIVETPSFKKHIFIKQLIWMMKNSRFVDNTNDQDTIAIISMIVANKHQIFFHYKNKVIWNNVVTYMKLLSLYREVRFIHTICNTECNINDLEEIYNGSTLQYLLNNPQECDQFKDYELYKELIKDIF